MDLMVTVSQIPSEILPACKTCVSTFFNKRLDAYPSKKCFTLGAVRPTTLEFLVRIQTVNVKALRSSFRTLLNKTFPCHASGIVVTIKAVKDSPLNISLDNSCQAKIDWTLPVISADHASGTQAAGPPSESNQGRTVQASSPSVLSDSGGCEPQDPSRIFTFSASQKDHDRLSGSTLQTAPEERTSSDLFVVKGKRGRDGGTGKLNSASRIVFVLSTAQASAKLEEFKNDLIEILQAKTYEAAVDATFSSDTQRLHVKIACTWKNAMHSHSIRRLIHGANAKRFEVDSNVRVFELKPGGRPWLHNQPIAGSDRWLHHSGVKGKAYSMPMRELLEAFGNVVKHEEAQLLSCTTHADFRANAESKQLLLANLLDVFQWRILVSPDAASVVNESAQPIAETGPSTLSCGEPSNPNSEPPAPASPASPRPGDVASDHDVTTPSSTRRNLNFTPMGGAAPACDSQPGVQRVLSLSSWPWPSTDSVEVFLQVLRLWLNHREQRVGQAQSEQLNRDQQARPYPPPLRNRKAASL